MPKAIFSAAASPPPLETQVAVLIKAVRALTGIIHTYALPAVMDADITKVRNCLADIHAQLNWAET